MYGDTSAIRHRARELRRLADDIRADADLLATRSAAVPWQGVAADAMRVSASAGIAGLRRAADLHVHAAAALDEHAEAVDRVKRLIAAIEHRVMALVAAPRDRLSGVVSLVGSLIDPVDEWLDRFVPPPSGHRDWLTVAVPGLHVSELAA